jgi:hypothetical protein
VDAYLERVRAELRMPLDMETDIVEEIRGHLTDATDALVEEGLHRGRAQREALARLGAPDVLADQLRRAHQTRRRLLAAAAGGIWTVGSEGLYGLIFGSVFLSVAALLGLTISVIVIAIIGTAGQPWISSTTLTAVAWAFAAERGARAATLVVADRSRRRVRQVAVPIALLGGVVLAWLTFFVVRMTLDWPIVACVLAIPAAFPVGALRAREGDLWRWRPRRTWPTLLAVAALVALITTVAAMVVPARTFEFHGGTAAESDSAYGFDRIASDGTSAAAAWLSGSPSVSSDRLSFSWTVERRALRAWHAFRVEIWRSDGDSGPIARDAVRPVAILPLRVSDGIIRGSMDPPRYRDLTAGWFVLTALDAHGVRYFLDYPESASLGFRGTILDWFRSGDTPDR